jgi:hypothetical protein
MTYVEIARQTEFPASTLRDWAGRRERISVIVSLRKVIASPIHKQSIFHSEMIGFRFNLSSMRPRQRATQNPIKLYSSPLTKNMGIDFAKGIILFDGINQRLFGIGPREFGWIKAQGRIEAASREFVRFKC